MMSINAKAISILFCAFDGTYEELDFFSTKFIFCQFGFRRRRIAQQKLCLELIQWKMQQIEASSSSMFLIGWCFFICSKMSLAMTEREERRMVVVAIAIVGEKKTLKACGGEMLWYLFLLLKTLDWLFEECLGFNHYVF